MKSSRWILCILMLFLLFPLSQVSSVCSSEGTTEDKLFDFLSSVVGLDLTKYAVVEPYLPTDVEYPSNLSESLESLNFTIDDEFGGLVKKEVLSPQLEINERTINLMGIFYNGHMAFLKIYFYSKQDYVYSESPQNDVLSQAKNILHRYQTFVSQHYGTNASYIVSMQNVLSSVDDLSPAEITAGNVSFQVSKDGDTTRIQWIYTQNDIEMNYKRLAIKFQGNNFVSFTDTWGLYSVSELDKISSEQAVQIALESAQDYEIRIAHEDNKTEIVKVPDLSNAHYVANFYMVPFRYEETNFPIKTDRDPLTLYPYWQIHFYFDESIARIVGIQVGVWGDTGEIVYCSGFGYLGYPEMPNEQNTTIIVSDELPLEEQKQLNTLDQSTLVIAVSTVAVLIIATAASVFRIKSRRQQL
ncbi:MAG: hypothetical protein NWF06_04760 [Candidatus Bathyarchaeota archaeon]|nr:hypothetical protein [Candidatus Bathyarchaeum sp.]